MVLLGIGNNERGQLGLGHKVKTNQLRLSNQELFGL